MCVRVSTCTVHVVTGAGEGAVSVKTISRSSPDAIVDIRLTLIDICAIIDDDIIDNTQKMTS